MLVQSDVDSLEVELRCHRPKKKSILINRHMARRLNWAWAHI